MSAKNQPCLCVTTSVNRAEEISWQLVDLGALSVEQRDHTTMDKPDRGQAELVAGFADRATRDSAARKLEPLRDAGDEICEIDVEDDGWSTRWREFFKPVVLDRLQVVTPWMELPRTDRIPIVIDPGQAFGTGGHATTKLVLQMLEQRAATATLPDSVLDVGVGSGVLAIAAVKLGVKAVTAVDIDPESVVATRENAQRNHVEESIQVYAGSPQVLAGEWPLVLANLELGVFTECAEALARRVAVGGEVLLSGLLSHQVETCLALWPGFRVKGKREQDGWVGLALEPEP